MLKTLRNKKIQDISKLFNILEITDEYIFVKSRKENKYVHIYSIEPTLVFGLTNEIKENIFNVYGEFLRSMSCDFEIYSEIIRQNLNDYFVESFNDSRYIYTNNVKKQKLLNLYKENLQDEASQNCIYISRYYIVVSSKSNSDILELNNNINTLNNLGCFVKKVIGKENIKKFIYSKINKV